MVTQVSVGHAWLNLRDSLESRGHGLVLAELADRSLEERHAAEPLYALLRRAYELLDAGMAPTASPAGTRCTCSTSWAFDPRWTAASNATGCSRRTTGSVGAAARRRAVRSLSRPPNDRAGLTLEALKLLKAYQRLDVAALAALRIQPSVERETEAALREFTRQALEREAKSLAFLDRSAIRRSRRSVRNGRLADAATDDGARALAACRPS